VSDYRVKISVSNARIRRAMQAAGYTSVLQMCRVKNLSIGATFDLVNMKASPLNQKGEWRKCVLDLADALYSLPDDLFSERQKVLVLKSSTGSKDVTEAELTRISEQHVWDNRLEDMQDNEGIREIAHEQTEDLLKATMDACLTPREKKVLEARFGFLGKEETLDGVAKQFDLSRERIRHIEFKALGKLRTQSGFESQAGKILRGLKDNINE
jgi:RNA polymerase sigma factor (sigma-70 family)